MALGRYMLLLLPGSLLISACSRPRSETVDFGAADASGHRSLMRGTAADGSVSFARRIDGNIVEVISDRVTADEDQLVVRTGTSGGTDQCKVMVFSGEGDLLVEHRTSGISPFPQPEAMARGPGETRRQLQYPSGGQLKKFTHDGRRFLAVGTGGIWYPSSVEILEVTSRRSLAKRCTVWNRGSLSYFSVAEGKLALIGLNNSFRKEGQRGFPVGVGVFDLSADLAGPPPREPAVRIVPGKTQPATGCLRYYLLPVIHGLGDPQILPLTIETDSNAVRVPMESGLTYRFRIDDGSITVEANDAYRLEYEERRSADSSLPTMEARLAEVKGGVELLVGK